jgi:hypothetical protein
LIRFLFIVRGFMGYLNWHMKRERMDRRFSDVFESSGGVMVGTEEIKGPYINPDRVYFDGMDIDKRPFIYLGNDVVSGGKLHIMDRAGMTHRDLINRRPEVQKRMDDLGYIGVIGYRTDGLEHDLMGRMGYWEIPRSGVGGWENVPDIDFNYGFNIPILLVSFWNPSIDVYNRNFLVCLSSMKEYFVDKNVFVSTPLLGTVHISKVMGGGAVGVAMSDEEKEKMDLQNRLHLMGPIEKKAAMEKLGLGGVKTSSRGDWEAGMRKLGMGGYMRQSEWSVL